MTNNRRLGVALLQYSIITWLTGAGFYLFSNSYLGPTNPRLMLYIGFVAGSLLALVYRYAFARSRTYSMGRELLLALFSSLFGTNIMGLLGIAFYLTGSEDIPLKNTGRVNMRKRKLAGSLISLLVLLSLAGIASTLPGGSSSAGEKRVTGFAGDLRVTSFAQTNGKLYLNVKNGGIQKAKINRVVLENNEGKKLEKQLSKEVKPGDRTRIIINSTSSSERLRTYDLKIFHDTGDVTGQMSQGDITGWFKIPG